MPLSKITYLVPDYDHAIAWLRDGLAFTLLEDTDKGQGKRWVVMQPPGGGVCLLLARATTPAQEAAIGQQAGDRVAYFYHTADFDADYARLTQIGIRFTELPREEEYGQVVVFLDPYGNKWDLIQPR